MAKADDITGFGADGEGRWKMPVVPAANSERNRSYQRRVAAGDYDFVRRMAAMDSCKDQLSKNRMELLELVHDRQKELLKEKNPDLKSFEALLKLQDQLVESENQLTVSSHHAGTLMEKERLEGLKTREEVECSIEASLLEVRSKFVHTHVDAAAYGYAKAFETQALYSSTIRKCREDELRVQAIAAKPTAVEPIAPMLCSSQIPWTRISKRAEPSLQIPCLVEEVQPSLQIPCLVEEVQHWEQEQASAERFQSTSAVFGELFCWTADTTDGVQPLQPPMATDWAAIASSSSSMTQKPASLRFQYQVGDCWFLSLESAFSHQQSLSNPGSPRAQIISHQQS